MDLIILAVFCQCILPSTKLLLMHTQPVHFSYEHTWRSLGCWTPLEQPSQVQTVLLCPSHSAAPLVEKSLLAYFVACWCLSCPLLGDDNSTCPLALRASAWHGRCIEIKGCCREKFIWGHMSILPICRVPMIWHQTAKWGEWAAVAGLMANCCSLVIGCRESHMTCVYVPAIHPSCNDNQFIINNKIIWIFTVKMP